MFRHYCQVLFPSCRLSRLGPRPYWHPSTAQACRCGCAGALAGCCVAEPAERRCCSTGSGPREYLPIRFHRIIRPEIEDLVQATRSRGVRFEGAVAGTHQTLARGSPDCHRRRVGENLPDGGGARHLVRIGPHLPVCMDVFVRCNLRMYKALGAVLLCRESRCSRSNWCPSPASRAPWLQPCRGRSLEPMHWTLAVCSCEQGQHSRCPCSRLVDNFDTFITLSGRAQLLPNLWECQ